MAKTRRLDAELVERGLFESREKAKRAIMAGEVFVGGHRVDKASVAVKPEAEIEHRGRDRYVGRGAYKLEGALKQFHLNPTDWRCLDVGSSTGGFTDCLLQHGAASVTAVDVGTNQLHWRLREDPRVEVHEGVNARHLDGLGWKADFDVMVTDVSFISLRLILPPALGLLRPGGQAVALIKPQFEAGRKAVGKGGIVRDKSVHREVVAELTHWLDTGDLGFHTATVAPSPIEGRDGNREFLWHIVAKS